LQPLRNYPMRKITIEISDKDYMSFQSASNNSGLKVDEKISEIIQYYIIIERNRKKFSQSTLFTTTRPESWFLYLLQQSFLHEPHKLALSPYRMVCGYSPENNKTSAWRILQHYNKWCCKSKEPLKTNQVSNMPDTFSAIEWTTPDTHFDKW